MSWRFLCPFLLIGFLFLTACKNKSGERSAMASAFEKKERNAGSDEKDMESIRRSGELIVATLSGPETYYEHHGIPMGLQYALAENFAASEGLKLRVELGQDTTSILKMLHEGEVDIAVLPISQHRIAQERLLAAGFHQKKTQSSWAVQATSQELATALKEWFADGVVVAVRKEVNERLRQVRTVKRRAQAVYLSRERGIISIYDHLFHRAAAITGWDWRLIAAQCYQESAFDPNARSWAGAQGLMQLMPATARSLGVEASQVYQPEINVDAGARYLHALQGKFSDIRDGAERIKFVLAAYNGGAGHVRDAMALARKYGRNPQRWDDVAFYILGLQEARYYRDPIVRHGYMIGSETEGYVRSILQRYQGYGGNIAVPPKPVAARPAAPLSTSHSTSSKTTSPYVPKTNKYSSGRRILTPDDLDSELSGS